MKRLWNTRKKRILLGILLFLFLIVLAGILILNSSAFESYLIKRADRYLKARYDLSLTTTSLDLSLTRLAVTLENVQIKAVSEEASPLKLFSARLLHINLTLAILLSKRVHIQQLRISNPQIVFSQNNKDSVHSLSINQDKNQVNRKAVEFRIDDLILDNGSLVFNNHRYDLHASLNRILVAVHYSEKEQIHQGLIQSQGGEIRISQSSLAVKKLLLEFNFNPESIQINRFTINSDLLSAEASGWMRDYQLSPQYVFEIRTSVQLAQLRPLIGLDNRFAGNLTVTGKLRGESGRADFSGTIMGQDAVLYDIPVAELEAAFEGSKNYLSVSHLKLALAEGILQGKLNASLDSQRPSSVDIQWDSISLRDLTERFPLFPLFLSAKTKGQLSAVWPTPDLKSITADGNIAFISSGEIFSDQGKSVSLEGRVKFNSLDGNINIHPSVLSFNRSSLFFSGNLDKDKTLKAKFQLKADDLAVIEDLVKSLKNEKEIARLRKLLPLRLSGGVSLAGEVTGTVADPVIAMSLEGQEIALNQMQIIEIKSALAYRQGSIDISQFLVEFKQGSIRGKGQVSYDPIKNIFGKKTKLTFNIEELDTAPIIAALPFEYPVQGIFSGEITLSGVLSNPFAEFSANLSHFMIEKEDFSRVTMEGIYRPQYLKLTKIGVSKGEGRLEGTLSLDGNERSYEVNLTGKNFELADFKSLSSEDLGGKVDLRFAGQGTLEKPEFTLGISLQKLRVFHRELDFLKLEVNAEGTTLKSLVYTPLGQSTLESHLYLQKPYVIQGRFSTTSLDAFNLIRPGVKEFPSEEGSEITALASFSIPLKNWEDSTLHIEMEKAVFDYRGLKIQNTHPVVLHFESGELIVQDFRVSGPNTELAISGRLPLDEEKSGRLTTAGTIQLKLVEPFVPKVQAKGSLIFQSEIIGSLLKPSLSAQVELREGEVTSPDIPYNIRDVVLLAKIDENSVNLERFSAGLDEGNISAHGKFSLTSLFSVEKAGENDIALIIKNLNLGNLTRLAPIESAAEFGGILEGTVRFQGNFRALNQLEIEGELSRLLLSLSRFELENTGKIKFSLKNSVFHLDELRLSGGNSSIFAAGNIDLSKELEMDVRFSANLDSAALTPFFKSVSSGGMILLDLDLKGSPSRLAIIGEGEVKDGFFEVRDLPIIATNIKGKIQFSESSLNLSSLQGILNGGAVKIQGKLDYQGFSVESVSAEIIAEGVQMNYPPGLQAQANGTLFLEGKGDQWRLSGDMKVAQAYYGMNIYPGAELVSNIRFRRARIKSEMPLFLQHLNLDVGLSSLDSIVIKNNLASLELEANIRILGTLEELQLSGRVVNRYVGEIIFADRTFEVEQASIDFLGTDPLEGQLYMIAHTYLTHNYDDLEITLTLSGPISKLDYSLSSFPPRPQGELASLLITGYGIEKLRSETANIVGNQMVLYFASPLASPVAERIKNILRAEEVSIEPINIATEEDPGARFTFRRGLVKNVDLVYSIDVSNTQHHTWILEYDLSRNFTIHSFRKDDGSYGSMLSHRFFLDPFIPKSQALYETQRRYIIKEVKLEGDLAFPPQLLKKKIRFLKKGTSFNHGELRKSIDKLMAFYKENKYLNVVINPGIRYEDNKNAIITLNISAQKPALIVYAGDPVSQKTKNEVVNSWNGRLPEEMALEEAKSRIINDLKSKGFYEAEVKVKKSVTDEQSVYAFSVNRGPRYRIQTFALEGQSSMDADTIQKAISKIPRTKGKGLWALVYDFRRARVRIRDLYTEKGYLNAVISPPQVQVDRNQKIIHITLPVEQGLQSRIHSIEIKGNQVFKAEELKKGLRSAVTSIYRPSLLSEDRNHLFNFYKSKGYQDVTVGVEVVSEPEGPEVNLIFTIYEGELHTIAEIDISGNIRTPDYVIRRELLFRNYDPVNMEKLMLSQKKLYDLSIFKSVNIRRQPLEGKTGQEKIQVEVQEDSMFALSYGLRYSSEEKFEVFGQLDSINIFGRGRNGLLYYKWNERQKNLRFSLKEPYLFGKRFNTLHSFYYLEETLATFKTEEIGYTIQQELQLPFDFSLSYLYRLRRIHEYELESFGPFVFDITLFLSELQTYVVRDTRNNKLNARQGSFFSLSLTYSPEFLGSDLTYFSLFCQYSLYKSFGSRIIWASNYRVGLADAFEQVLIPSKRFYAGGGNSIRGFKRDLVGPYDPFLQRPEGGEAVFIMNQELRFPVYKWLEGVVFYDIGNVYENLGDFNPFDVRQSLGLGLRLNTPVALIRVDYGINLSPRRDEPKGVLFFSIGQSF